jgi:hypothetical protein
MDLASSTSIVITPTMIETPIAETALQPYIQPILTPLGGIPVNNFPQADRRVVAGLSNIVLFFIGVFGVTFFILLGFAISEARDLKIVTFGNVEVHEFEN